MSPIRLSLLAGSSLVAFTLASPALAANECNPAGTTPATNGAAADVFACNGATTYQTTGITYSSQGDLRVNATGAMNVGSVGVNLTGNTTGGVGDNVTFTSNNVLTGTSGPVVDITSTSGVITATFGGFTATAAGATYGLRAQSTGGGNITLTKTNANALNNNVAGGEAVVAAITNGGNIAMTVNAGSFDTQAVRGRLRGLVAQTSGAGAVTMTVGGSAGFFISDVDGIATLDVTAGTGGATINVGTTRLTGGAGDVIRAVSTGVVTVNNTDGVIDGSVDFSGVTAGGVNFLNAGSGSGPGGRWLVSKDSVFSGQADTLGLAGPKAHVLSAGASIEFGAGNDAISMSGSLVVEDAVVTGLETFNNSGTIYMGVVYGSTDATAAIPQASDGVADDRLSLPGATFTGTGASRIILDVILGGVSQVGCETITTADCLDLSDGSTAGSTLLTINDVSPGSLLSGYSLVTVIDVSGSGTTSPTHFTLDPASTLNVIDHPLYGQAVDHPSHFVYLFRYDDENQRYVFAGQPRDGSLFAYSVLPAVAQSVWQLTADTVTDRQTDLRKGGDNTVWLRASGEYSKRDVSTAFEGWDGTIAFDNSYKLYAGTIMAGRDFFVGQASGYDYVLGAQIGYVSSSLDMDMGFSGRMTGATGGVYASLWDDWFFLDGAVNLNGLALDYQAPALASKTTTFVNSVGVQAETGVRAAISERVFAEPLVTFSYVRSSFEEISLSGATIRPEDGKSIRGALGLRLGGTLSGDGVSATYFVTGRAWNEFEGEAGGVAINPGADLPFADDFSGAFGEAELGVNVFNAVNTLSGFVTSGVKWKDGYSAVDLALGMRMAW